MITTPIPAATTSVAPIPVTPEILTVCGVPGSFDFGFDGISDQLFKKVESCVYDLRTGQLGVRRGSQNGYAVYVPADGTKKAQLQVCPITAFGLPIPAYAIRTTIDKLEPGDVVIVPGSSSATWFYYLKHEQEGDLQNTCVHGIRVEDGVKTEVMLTDSMFLAGDGLLCVKNVIGKKTELTKMLPLLALLGAGGKGEEGKDKFSKLILFMLMGQGSDMSGHSLDMKSLLPLLLLNGGGGDNSLITAALLASGGLFGK